MSNTTPQLVYPITPQQNAALFPPKNETDAIVISYEDPLRQNNHRGMIAFAGFEDGTYESLVPGVQLTHEWELLEASAERAVFTVRGSLLVASKPVLPEKYLARWEAALRLPLCFSEIKTLYGFELHAEITGPAAEMAATADAWEKFRFANFAAFLAHHGMEHVEADSAGIATVRITIASLEDLIDVNTAIGIFPFRLAGQVKSRWLLQNPSPKKVGTTNQQLELQHEL